LNTLDRPVKNKVIERILLLSQNPRPVNSKKLIGAKLAWRLRIWDWRILYEVNDKRKEVKIYRVKHRSQAYDF